MKKKALVLIFLSLSVLSCAVKQKNKAIPTIFYGATERGYSLQFKIENQRLFIYPQKNKVYAAFGESTKSKSILEGKLISDDDWKTIVNLVQKVNLEEVKNLKWPTEKRYYDGAAHANISFNLNGVTYTAQGFDHGFPPKEIAELVHLIVKIAETEAKAKK